MHKIIIHTASSPMLVVEVDGQVDHTYEPKKHFWTSSKELLALVRQVAQNKQSEYAYIGIRASIQEV